MITANLTAADAAAYAALTRNRSIFAMLPCQQCGAPAPAGKPNCQSCDNHRRANR